MSGSRDFFVHPEQNRNDTQGMQPSSQAGVSEARAQRGRTAPRAGQQGAGGARSAGRHCPQATAHPAPAPNPQQKARAHQENFSAVPKRDLV